MPGSIQLLQPLEKFVVVRNAFLDKPDQAVFVDQVGHPAPAVFLLDGPVFVGHKGKVNPVFIGEPFIRHEIVAADPDHLSIQGSKFFQIPLEGNQLVGSDRGKRGEIKGQHNIPLTAEIRQLNFSPGRRAAEMGGFVPDFEAQ
jgi:hypothetical protein